MTISGTEQIQISIEIIGGIITLLFSVAILPNRLSKKSSRYFASLFIVTSLLFFFEASVYFFRGNTNNIGMIGNRLGNFIVFSLNIVLLNLFSHFVQNLVKEHGGSMPRYFLKWINTITVLAGLILVTNIFTGWMYTFDELNYYHRGILWYVYTFLFFSTLVFGSIVSMGFKKILGRRLCFSILTYATFPLVAVVIQTFFYGISLVSISLGISIIIMFINYIYDRNHKEISKNNLEYDENRFADTMVMFLIMAMCIGASIVSCVVSINSISKQVSDRNNTITAILAESQVVREFLRPISISEAMSNDIVLKNYLKMSNDKESAEEIADEMIDYLYSIRTGLGYKMAFAASDASKAYYTYLGLSKFLSPDDAHDIWYSDTLKSTNKYQLNLDTDEDNNWSLSVFINTKVFDDDGKLLGVCGIGVEMDALKQIISNYEEEYGVNIFLTDSKGLILVSSDISKINNESIDNSDFHKTKNGDFYYLRTDDSSKFIKYISELGMYLVIQDSHPSKISVKSIIIPNIIISFIGIIILAVMLYSIEKRNKRTKKELFEKRLASITDGLTGLKNRRGYEEDIESLKIPGGLAGITFVNLDVNGLKSVNDNIGHNAGDELIVGAADCIKDAFSTLGNTYRTGGDEFVAILNCDPVSARASLDKLSKDIKEWKGELVESLSISIGMVICDEHPGISFTDATELADKSMYEDKNRYYRETGKDRRRK